MRLFKVIDHDNLLRIEEEGGGRITTRIEGDSARIPDNPAVKELIEKCSAEGCFPQRQHQTFYAKKELKEKEPVYETEDAMVDGMEVLWHQEVQYVKNQPNIGWKVCWMMNRRSHESENDL